MSGLRLHERGIVKNYYLAVPDRTPIPCFSCGNRMTFIKGEKTRECQDCEVTELRLQGEYTILTRAISSGPYCGEWVEYIDHSRVHSPNP